MNSRRDFLKHAGMGVAAAALLNASDARAQGAAPAAKSAGGTVKLGLASYSVRKFPFDQALVMAERVGLKRVVFKADFHLPLNSTDELIKERIAAAKARGLEVYGTGTVNMKTEADVDQAFHYARTAGMQMIICAPAVALLPAIEKKVKATGVWIAIHNHGPDNPLFPSPLDAYAAVKGMDQRMGLCVDIGHTQRLGQDPIQVFKTTFDRVFDVHIKDVNGSTKAGKTVEIGRGIIDIVGFLKTVLALKYAHTLGFEYEKDENDPLAGLAESVGYVRGVLKSLGA